MRTKDTLYNDCGRLGNLISQKQNKKAEGYHDQLCSGTIHLEVYLEWMRGQVTKVLGTVGP